MPTLSYYVILCALLNFNVNDRFSDISGKLNEHKFKQAYSFLDEHQEREVESLEKAVKQAKDPEVAARLKQDLKRYVNLLW